MSYIPCELHCHTVHSDGDFLPKELQRSAKNSGLSLIALTDHNTVSGCSELDKKLLPYICGIEWTTYYGHVLVLGAKAFVDWRDAEPDNIDEKIEEVKSFGGLVGVAHPFQIGSPVCTGGRWEFNVKKWENIDYIEIWHEAFSKDNYENERALAFWTELLDKGYHLAATYGRDWHRVEKIGQFGCTYLDINGEPTQEKALNAIKRGKTVASAGAKLFFKVEQNNKVFTLGETAKEGKAKINLFCDIYARRNEKSNISYSEIRIITNKGKCIYVAQLNEKEIKLSLNPNSWYRAELWGTLDGKDMPLAVTSAIYT